ncbi:MAG: hypothetical protein GY862_16310 [Gammaproteobacteria bacterium]|nr:hypothetical protein [Gammaproteobacteria bacterium]
MSTAREQENCRLAKRRMRVLQKINAHCPYSVTDETILEDLDIDDSDIKPSKRELRQDLYFMAGFGLCKVEGATEKDTWVATIKSRGMNFLDGLVDDVDGVRRPQDL